mmetsp:Transcript_29896/g.49627  ORF Transcript_29896/g.49627 Transcript_29896/m.49627 type:complete len:140 (-) Transcript_29896:59-478(-)|eukprot:CAMPEP_0178854820 /NCGR_PEP_ID=MMETSP0746-20121128/23052_1 /TAXON_ID=913974 /ORGANISM="Nitzschia punctata, Strain CCMP561" /LENGTH=139 /DNA_ID=CAMNT_0020520863 /DNA_START=95 /DNA_END=514 /DNA_ORIENTATION=-
MDEVDHVANRVGLCTVTGFFGGAAYATFKGFPRRATALKAAASCALVATSLFGTERIANVALREYVIPKDDEQRLTMTSYAFSGVFGGGLNGYLYQKKPLRGMFYFVPLMLGAGILELEWNRRKRAKIEELQQQHIEEI